MLSLGCQTDELRAGHRQGGEAACNLNHWADLILLREILTNLYLSFSD